MKDQDFIEKTLERKEIFKGNILDVFVDTVALPNGETATRELVFHRGAVAILPITKEGKMVFVRQFRKPLEKIIFEIPAGKIEANEGNPLETAKRELEEETAYITEEFVHLNSFYLSPGFCNEELHLYLATNLQKTENPLPQDEDEVIELYEFTLEEAKEKLAKGSICDAKTVLALAYWELFLLKNNR